MHQPSDIHVVIFSDNFKWFFQCVCYAQCICWVRCSFFVCKKKRKLLQVSRISKWSHYYSNIHFNMMQLSTKTICKLCNTTKKLIKISFMIGAQEIKVNLNINREKSFSLGLFTICWCLKSIDRCTFRSLLFPNKVFKFVILISFHLKSPLKQSLTLIAFSLKKDWILIFWMIYSVINNANQM